MQNIVPLLTVILPLVGKVLLMVPFIPNKAIPFLLGLMKSVANYWFLLGFPALDTANAVVHTEVSMAGIGDIFGSIGRVGLAVGWGALDAVASKYFYDFKKVTARNAGKVSWLEQGKRSMF